MAGRPLRACYLQAWVSAPSWDGREKSALQTTSWTKRLKSGILNADSLQFPVSTGNLTKTIEKMNDCIKSITFVQYNLSEYFLLVFHFDRGRSWVMSKEKPHIQQQFQVNDLFMSKIWNKPLNPSLCRLRTFSHTWTLNISSASSDLLLFALFVFCSKVVKVQQWHSCDSL